MHRRAAAAARRLQVPPRLQTPIASILDPAEELKSCVILGFSRGGGHLLSYTAADGREGYGLQLWAFARHEPCRRLWSVPLFRAGGGVARRGSEEEEFDGPGALSVTIAETPGGELLGEGRGTLPARRTACCACACARAHA